MAPPAHPTRSPIPNALLALLGFTAGTGFAAWGPALAGTFGADSTAAITLAILGAIAFAAGASAPALPSERDLRGSARLGRRLGLLGLLLIVLSVAGRSGPVLAWAGAGVDASPWLVAFVRALVGLLCLVPAGWAAGSACRCITALLPEGAGAARWGVPAFTAGWALASYAGILFVEPSRFAAAFSGTVMLAVAVFLIRARRGGPEPATPAAAPTRDDVSIGLVAAGVAFGLSAFHFYVNRLFGLMTGDELSDLTVVDTLLGAGALVGTILGALLVSRARSFAASIPAMLVACASLVAVWLAGTWKTWPQRFATELPSQPDLDAALSLAVRLLMPACAVPALLFGASCVFLVRSMPAERGRREMWTRAIAIGGAIGFVFGSALARFALAPFGFDSTLAAIAAGAGALAIASFSLTRGRAVVRIVVALGVAAAVVALVRKIPTANPLDLLVDKDLRALGAPEVGGLRQWLAFDEQDDRVSAAVLRRGHVKRLLVNGRFEGSSESSAKSYGVLAHLPLAVHPAPKRVLVVGAATGATIAAVAAHDVERIDLFESGRVAVRAAVRFGPVASAAFSDERLRIHLGDFVDLLARADDYDVILLQPSGRWTQRAARGSTKETLSLVRDRLGAGGIACQWIPDSALTRDGFLALLATWAQVFPRVELWAGHGGDVIVLGSADTDAHDFERLLTAYRKPRVAAACAAAWIGTPETLLSQFLVGDASVRRLATGRTVHARSNGELARIEADRRRMVTTVDPVPGLAAIRDDVIAAFRNTPAEGFAPAIALALRARDLERTALDLEAENDMEKAEQAYDDALAANPSDGAVRRAFSSLQTMKGIEFANRSAFLAAHKFMLDAVETDTTYAHAFGNLGLLLMQAENYDYSIACTSQALALEPDDDLLLLQLGRTWKARGYFDKALPCYEDAMRLNPRNVEAAIGYVDTKLSMEGDPDIPFGIAFLKKYLAVDPQHEDLHARIQKFEDLQARRASRGAGPPPAGP